MQPTSIMFHLLQIPFENPFLPWADLWTGIFNVFLAFIIRGYLVMILLGLMVYATGLSDGTAKTLVVGGVILYFVGPYLLNIVSSLAGAEPPTIEQATLSWQASFGMTDAELIAFIVTIGDIIIATCVLIGAILYFTPSSSDLQTRGRSLIVRSLMLAPMLVFFHVAPLI